MPSASAPGHGTYTVSACAARGTATSTARATEANANCRRLMVCFDSLLDRAGLDLLASAAGGHDAAVQRRWAGGGGIVPRKSGSVPVLGGALRLGKAAARAHPAHRDARETARPPAHPPPRLGD